MPASSLSRPVKYQHKILSRRQYLTLVEENDDRDLFPSTKLRRTPTLLVPVPAAAAEEEVAVAAAATTTTTTSTTTMDRGSNQSTLRYFPRNLRTSRRVVPHHRHHQVRHPLSILDRHINPPVHRQTRQHQVLHRRHHQVRNRHSHRQPAHRRRHLQVQQFRSHLASRQVHHHHRSHLMPRPMSHQTNHHCRLVRRVFR